MTARGGLHQGRRTIGSVCEKNPWAGGGWVGWGEVQAGTEEAHSAGTCEKPETMVQATQLVEN